ncbi:unnamed protein product [Phytophthora fragariaefolia]|uniref:Unnamed protein product n=1 Tax=Phytophthora fragariaefolia TaxID=1490495 RepID=A0A9W6YM92_9STRA|nr:unnamed protein product [Phytophthora fragariaefolia]
MVSCCCCRVIGNVHGEIVPPFPDRPTEGFLHFAVELSPMASPSFEAAASAGRGAASSVAAAELARLVERGVRESRALDTEALAVVAGEKVWAITCHVHVVDHGGNLVDAASLAAIAALMHYRRPEVAVKEGTAGNGGVTVYSVDEHAAVPLSLHHIPISISFCFLQPAAKIQGKEDELDADEDGEPIIFMDPTDREESITDARMSFTFNSFRELCAVHKIGGAAISQSTVLRCANVAAARVVELTTFLKEEEEKADKEALQRRRALLRGRAFADVSSTLDEATAKSTVEKVDLGSMTDFATLHAPIALRDDPTKEETDQQVTSMAELLESLETAADLAEEDPTSSKSSAAGLAMTDAARDEFRQLANSETVRDLIHGGKKESSKSVQPTKKKPVVDSDSDSEEEGGVLQSEFGTVAKPEEPVKAKVITKLAKKASTKKGRKKKVESSSDEDEDMDLSAAIKRK